MIQIKRAWDKPSAEDGFRVLVERSWPSELDKKHAKVDLWLPEVAPSAELRQKFGESPGQGRWDEFQKLYLNELNEKHRDIKMLREKSREGVVTLVHVENHPDHCPAQLLKAYLESSTPREGV